MVKKNAKEPTRRLPPYIPYKTFKGFIWRLRSEPPLPSRIDRSYWGSSYSGSVGVQLVTALRFLDLVDEGKVPSEKLERLVQVEGTQEKEELRKLFLEAYQPVLGNLDISRVTPAQLEEVLKNYGVTDDAVRKKVRRFLIAMATDAGKQPSPSLLKRVKQERKRGKTEKGAGEKQKQRPSAGREANVDTLSIHPAISGLLVELPEKGSRWSNGERTRWIEAFTTLIKALYPIEDET